MSAAGVPHHPARPQVERHAPDVLELDRAVDEPDRRRLRRRYRERRAREDVVRPERDPLAIQAIAGGVEDAGEEIGDSGHMDSMARRSPGGNRSARLGVARGKAPACPWLTRTRPERGRRGLAGFRADARRPRVGGTAAESAHAEGTIGREISGVNSPFRPGEGVTGWARGLSAPGLRGTPRAVGQGSPPSAGPHVPLQPEDAQVPRRVDAEQHGGPDHARREDHAGAGHEADEEEKRRRRGGLPLYVRTSSEPEL